MKRKILTALLSVILAFALWAYVITVEKPEQTETYYNIPVALEGAGILSERGLMLVSGADTTVTMRIYGSRSALNKINSNNITLVADLTKITEAGEVELTYDYKFPGEVASNALTVQSREPDTVRVVVAERISKDVPVVINYTGEVPDPNMYIVDKENAVLDYPEVTVVGPDVVIDQIDHVAIDVDLTGRNQSFSETYRYTLCDQDGNAVDGTMVTTNVGEVRLELKIQRYKDVRLVVAVTDGGGATQSTSKIVIDPATIRVSGNEQVLAKLTEYNLGTVNLGELTKDTVLTFPITLDEGLTNMTGVTEATVKVSFPDLTTREFSVTDIQMLNVPEGMHAELVTKALMVSVRGPKDVVSKMTKSDIRVTVDFTDVKVGTATIKAKVVISDKYTSVGEVGTYSVSAILQEATDSTDTTGP